MREPYLEVTYRHGRPLAAYLYLPRRPGQKSFRTSKELALEIRNLSVRNDRGLADLDNFNMKIHRGQILGIAGVAGNGQKALAEVLTGLKEASSGRIMAGERDITNSSARGSYIAGIAHIPEDRKSIGIAPDKLESIFEPFYQVLGAEPDRRQGLGRALVNAGFDRLAEESILYVFVLGDPAYYSRLGFTCENAVMPPYALPPEWDGAWQSVRLRGATSPPPGSLDLPPVWLRPELWLP